MKNSATAFLDLGFPNGGLKKSSAPASSQSAVENAEYRVKRQGDGYGAAPGPAVDDYSTGQGSSDQYESTGTDDYGGGLGQPTSSGADHSSSQSPGGRDCGLVKSVSNCLQFCCSSRVDYLKLSGFDQHIQYVRVGDCVHCGRSFQADGKYGATVVVQANNLGIPGLVTSMDKLYEVSCDYSSMIGGKITAKANINVKYADLQNLKDPVLVAMDLTSLVGQKYRILNREERLSSTRRL